MRFRRLLSIVLAVCILAGLSAMACAASYSDVNVTDWYFDEVQYVSRNGLMSETGNGKFSPTLKATRAMVVTILWRLEGSPVVEGEKFTDVLSDVYYADAVLWASNGIVDGYGNGEFRPNELVTREQLATILYRYAQSKKCELATGKTLDTFTDAKSVSTYAKSAMEWAVSAGLLEGSNGKLMPKAAATRAQLAAILNRYNTGVLKNTDEYTCSKKIALGGWSILWSPVLLAQYPTLESQLAYVSACGYDGIELVSIESLGKPNMFAAMGMGLKDEELIAVGETEKRDALIANLKKYGLECPEYMWLAYSAEDVKAMVDWVAWMNESPEGKLTDTINVMPPMGSEAVNDAGTLSYERYVALRQEYVKDMQAFADYAATKGLKIALEIEPGEPFASPTEVVSVTQEINRKNVFVQLDLGHTHSMFNLTNKGRQTEAFGVQYDIDNKTGCPDLSKATVEEFFAAANKYVSAGVGGVQLWDNATSVEDTMNASGDHYALGEGNVDFERYLTALKEDAKLNSDWLILEFFSFSNPTAPQRAIESSPSALKSLFRAYEVY